MKEHQGTEAANFRRCQRRPSRSVRARQPGFLIKKGEENGCNIGRMIRKVMGIGIVGIELAPSRVPDTEETILL